MSTCARCGAQFSCAMADVDPDVDPAVAAQPCWCTYLPASLPVPSAPSASCWCPDCLKRHIEDNAAQDSAAQPPQAI
jgi:hypothetical protein